MVRENLNQTTGMSQAMAHITALEHQAFAGGNVDSEKSAFEEIAQKLTLNILTPEEAMAEAEKIVSKRQDYH